MPPPVASFAAQSATIALVVSLYWFVSISMVFLNKYLLSEISLDAPLFITWYQCVVTVAICVLLGAGHALHPYFTKYPRVEYESKIALQILPLSICFVAMITFNNLCLKHVGVAFYNVGRSLTTVFNVILTYFYLGEVTSVNCMLTCAIIVVGFFVGVDQESSNNSSLSLAGVMYGVLASFCVALNAIYTKKMMPAVEGNMWKLMAYNNINAVILFMPLMVLMGEYDQLDKPELTQSRFWILMTVAGVFGLAIGFVTVWQIDVTSALTHNISGTAKACAQTIIALQWKNESKSGVWWLSNFMVLGGSFAYTMVRRSEMQQAQSPIAKA